MGEAVQPRKQQGRQGEERRYSMRNICQRITVRLMKTILTTTDVAKRLGIDASRVRRLAADYGIGQKIGPRAWIFTEKDIAALQSRSTGKAGRPPRMPL